uniref:Major capsid protein n=1 Tax=Dulem virus 82 TaxID=3145793 RepID=A0AAU8B978_9VIRU
MKAQKHDYSTVPQITHPRNRFDLSHGVKTTMNVGTLYPVDWQEVLPGDTFPVKTYAVSRVSSSFLKPVMDNLFMDIYHFYVPYRLCYHNAEEVFGVAKPSAYIENELASFPSTHGNIASKSVADYLGLQPGVNLSNNEGSKVSLIPFRAFALIYNQWFRNENTVDEVYVQTGERASTEIIDNLAWSPSHYTGKLPKVKKYNDYFTSALPQPQKGPPVVIGLSDFAPVHTANVVSSSSLQTPLLWSQRNGNSLVAGSTVSNPLLTINDLDAEGATGLWSANSSSGVGTIFTVYPRNLVADLSEATAININDLRLAFQAQKMLERDAFYGSRFNEYLLGHWGVYAPDQRIQFPEYLGGSRSPLNIVQTVQTSTSTEDSPLGNVAGYSWTNSRSRFTKGFCEPGIVMTVACIRYKHSYQQGIPLKWTRLMRNDFYDPLYATIGQQPIYSSELFCPATVSTGIRNNVFGYKEAWAEYREIPNTVTGEMRTAAVNSQDIWHFADSYASAPLLSQAFTDEDPTFVDRALSVPSTSEDQFLVDFWFDIKAIRPLPLYSLPSLVDHH